MHRSSLRARVLVFLVVSASGAWALAACSSSSSPGPDDTTPDGGSSSGSSSGAGSTSSGGSSSGGSSGGSADAGKADAGKDGGTTADGGADGGPRDIGSCCTTQTTPGCNDPNLEICVCQKDPDCCTQAWTTACTLIVQDKYCQTGVRDCVCGTDAGQWGQTDCCNTDWNSTCDSVATLKCGAAQGCF